MSEKTDLELQADPSVQRVALDKTDATSQPLRKKKSLRRRVWKTLYLYQCHLMAAYVHRFAIDHAQETHRARWDEVMVPHVENLVDWIKLFMGISRGHLFSWMDSTAFLVVTLASFVGYACWYFDCNKRSDRYQRHIVALVSVFDFGLALSLGFGPVISTLCVAPRAIIAGLLVSDLAHLMLPGLQRKGDGSVDVGGPGIEKA